MVLSLHCVLELCGGLDKVQVTGPTSVSSSVGLGWHLRICISSKCPGDTNAAGLGTTLWRTTGEF